MDELLKDADVIHHTMNDSSKAIKEKEQARYYSFTDDGKSEFAGGIQLRRSNREVNHGNKGKSGRNVLVCTFFN